jgi:ADP-ribosyl-[dinitrogen reductase] hydrolase
MTDQPFKDRFFGAMIGLAVGDMVGFPLEFKKRGDFAPVNDYQGDGTWTDDTAMALCLAKSLTESLSMDLKHQLDLYVKWYLGDEEFYGGHVDCGMTISEALNRYRRYGEVLSGAKSEYSAGNGSIMRLAPVPLYFHQNLSLAIRMAELSSKTTHQEQRCLQACQYFSALTWGALNGHSKKELLSPYFPNREFWQETSFHPDIQEVIEGSYQTEALPPSSGFVVHTLNAALWAFYQTDCFEDGLLEAVNLGDDADTTGAVFGQLAGAFYGFEAIPTRWKDRLKKRDYILKCVENLFEVSRG